MIIRFSTRRSVLSPHGARLVARYARRYRGGQLFSTRVCENPPDSDGPNWRQKCAFSSNPEIEAFDLAIHQAVKMNRDGNDVCNS